MCRSANLFPNLAAFLDMIAYSEGTLKYGNDDGYNVIVGGSLFSSYSDHPRKLVILSPTLKSTAAGRYQLMARYATPYMSQLHLKDFSPISQDAIAIQIIREQGALKNIMNGDIVKAIQQCSNIWASFPGAGYNQRENKIDTLISKYKEFGGKLNGA